MFRLTKEEKIELVTKCHRLESLKHSVSNPYAFTEHGALMLANVIKSPIAIEMSIMIVKTFNKLREMISSHKDLLKKIEAMEEKYDEQFKIVFETLKQLIIQEEKPKRKIGFHNIKAN